MTDPTPTQTHFDPATAKLIWGAVVAFCTVMMTALTALAVVAAKARTWFLRSERAAKTDDIVHGTKRTYEPDEHRAKQGLGQRVEALEDAYGTRAEREAAEDERKEARLQRVERALKLAMTPEEQAEADRARFLDEAKDTGAYRALRAEHFGAPAPKPRQLPFPSTHHGRDDNDD